MIAVLSGGVGGARLCAGLQQVFSDITAIVNTGDDETFHGLYVCPDIDTNMYTLSGLSDWERGWGRAYDTFACSSELARFGVPNWFNIGDRDLAMHLARTQLLRAGAELHDVTDILRQSFDIDVRLIPMTNDTAPTIIESANERLRFQEWFVRDLQQPEVRGIDLSAARNSQAAPGVIAALQAADIIVIAPSNPLVSLDPILAVPGIRKVITARRAEVIAVSPIIAGRTVKGPADRMLTSQNLEPSCVGVASYYRGLCNTFVIDNEDASRRDEIKALGFDVHVCDTRMTDVQTSAVVAKEILEAANG